MIVYKANLQNVLIEREFIQYPNVRRTDYRLCKIDHKIRFLTYSLLKPANQSNATR